MKKIGIFTIFVILVFGALFLIKAVPRPKEVTNIVVPKEIDIGVVTPKSLKNVSVEISNTGDIPVKLFSFQGSCSCTIPSVKELTIPAHEKALLPVSIRFGPGEGDFAESIYFVTDVSPSHEVFINFKGFISELIRATPERITFYSAKVDSLPVLKHSVIKFSNKRGQWSNISIVNPDPNMFATLAPLKDGSEYDLIVTLGKQAACGEIDNWVEVRGELNGELVSKRIPVGGVVEGKYNSDPAAIFLIQDNKLPQSSVIHFKGLPKDRNLKCIIEGEEISNLVKIEKFDWDSAKVSLKKSNFENRYSGNLIILGGNGERLLVVPIYVSVFVSKEE